MVPPLDERWHRFVSRPLEDWRFSQAQSTLAVAQAPCVCSIYPSCSASPLWDLGSGKLMTTGSSCCLLRCNGVLCLWPRICISIHESVVCKHGKVSNHLYSWHSIPHTQELLVSWGSNNNRNFFKKCIHGVIEPSFKCYVYKAKSRRRDSQERFLGGDHMWNRIFQ